MKLKVIIIEWIDAIYTDMLLLDGTEENWLQLKESALHVGFLVKETEKFIAIASLFIPTILTDNHKKCDERKDLLHDQLREVYTIPKSNVIKIHYLKEIETDDIVETKRF